MQQTEPAGKESTKCENHQNRSGTYFLSEQPWIKFCPECALNVALYGRRIEKHLTESQIKTKTSINTYHKELESRLQDLEATKKSFEGLLIRVQPNEQSICELLKFVDEYICELGGLRDNMKNQYEQRIHKTVEECHERQTRILLQQIQIKRQIEYVHIDDNQIENNYGNLIDDQLKAQPKKQQWAELLQATEGIVLGADGTAAIEAAIDKGQLEIRNSLSKIPGIKLMDKYCLNSIGSSSISHLFKSREQTGVENCDHLIDYYDSIVSGFSSVNDKQPNGDLSKKFSKLKLRSRSKQNTCEKNSTNSRKKTRYSLRDKTHITNLTSMSTLTAFQFD